MGSRTLLPESEARALEFLNARLGPDPGAAVAWLCEAGMASEEEARRLAESPPLARILLGESLALQDALAEAAEAFAQGAPLPPSALFALNRVLDAHRGTLRVQARGSSVVLREVADVCLPAGLLAPIAAGWAHILAERDHSRLRRCAAERCRRWFFDVSRNGGRGWCSMARCGNRAKAAAHYRRRRTARAGED